MGIESESLRSYLPSLFFFFGFFKQSKKKIELNLFLFSFLLFRKNFRASGCKDLLLSENLKVKQGMVEVLCQCYLQC